MNQSSYLLLLIVALILAIIQVLLREETRVCTVVITGESVRISACTFNADFVEFAKYVKPAGAC